MMEATDFVKLHDPARVGEFNWPDVGRILVEREMRASPVIVREVANEDAAQGFSLRTRTWFRHSRRIEPMSRSARGFCHGLCVPMPLTRCRNAGP
jgi:hypothetical protein